MDNSVVIKGSKHGIVVFLDKECSFDNLKIMIKEKFEQSAKFFGKANMAISFEGREVSNDEQKELVGLITEVTELNILCIVDTDEKNDERFEAAVNAGLNNQEEAVSETTNDVLFYKGTLRSGQVVEAETSVIVLGDVNPGGKVIAKGNVIILGSLKGYVVAGANGNVNAFVVALEMKPMQIKIGDVIARSQDGAPVNKKDKAKAKQKVIQPKIAFVEDGNIYIEDLNQEILEDIRIN